MGAELGCFLSHKRALDYIVVNKLPCALIFEDDAIIKDNLSSVVASLINHNAAPSLVRFIGKEKVYSAVQKKIFDIDGTSYLARIQGTPGDACAYYITQRGAVKLLQRMNKIYLPFDTFIGHAWTTGVDNLCVIPSPVAPDFDEPSIIGDARFSKKITLKGMARVMFPFTRFYFKIYEGIFKRLTFYWRNLR